MRTFVLCTASVMLLAAAAPIAAKNADPKTATCDARYYDYLVGKHLDAARDIAEALARRGLEPDTIVNNAGFGLSGDIIDLPKMLELCRQYNAWLMIDEAHRTQSGDLGDNLFQAFPGATRLAFTGTPLIEKQDNKVVAHRTVKRFGELPTSASGPGPPPATVKTSFGVNWCTQATSPVS